MSDHCHVMHAFIRCMLPHAIRWLGCRGVLQSSFTNAASPAASRYHNASAAQDSEDEAHSPQHHPYQSSPAAPGSSNRPDIPAALLQATSPRSPLSAGPLSSGPAGMAGSHVTSRTASYTAATHRAGASGASGAASGRSSLEVSQAAISKAVTSGGFSPMSAALHAKQQLGLSPRGSALPGALDAAAAAAAALGDAAAMVASRESSISPGPSRLGVQEQVVQRPGTDAASYVPQVSPRAAAGGAPAHTGKLNAAAASTGRSNQGQQPQPSQQRFGAGVTVAAAVAKKDYLNSSFNDSDDC
jgi:hypothetical protein